VSQKSTSNANPWGKRGGKRRGIVRGGKEREGEKPAPKYFDLEPPLVSKHVRDCRKRRVK